MRASVACALSVLIVADAYTPPARRSPRAPKGPGGRPSPRRKREVVVEPLESWGRFDVGPHRLGASTVSWGDASCGWVAKLRRKKGTSGEVFGLADVTKAYAKLQGGGVVCWDVSAGSKAALLLGDVADANPSLDPPKAVVRCAPSLRARLFGRNAARTGNCGVSSAVDGVAEALGTAYVDAVLAGPPLAANSAAAVKKAAGALARVGGRADCVGVANVRGGGALRAAHAALEARGLRLAVASVDFSLVDSGALRDGTMEAAKELDITVLARAPLYAGLGAGEITARNPTGGAKFGVAPRWRFRALNELAPLHDALERVASMVQARRADDGRAAAAAANREVAAEKPVDVRTAQVALQWIRAKGAVPMPAVKTEAHAKVVLGCKGWALTEAEVRVIDAVLPRKPPAFPRLR